MIKIRKCIYLLIYIIFYNRYFQIIIDRKNNKDSPKYKQLKVKDFIKTEKKQILYN